MFKNMRFINLSKDIFLDDMSIDFIESRLANVIIFWGDETNQNRSKRKIYKYWLSKISNIVQDSSIYKTQSKAVQSNKISKDVK